MKLVLVDERVGGNVEGLSKGDVCGNNSSVFWSRWLHKFICVIRYGTYIPCSKVEFLVLILCYKYVSCNHWGNWVKEHLCTIFETSRESIIISKF